LEVFVSLLIDTEGRQHFLYLHFIHFWIKIKKRSKIKLNIFSTIMYSLIPRDFFDMDRFFDEENWRLPQLFSIKLSEPALDLYETDKEVVAELSVSGFDPKKIEATVEDQCLRIKGSMEKEKEEKKKEYWRKEIRKGSFERLVRLPSAVDEKKIKASYKKGVLKITMPKITVAKAKKVKIKVEKE
jgi:HSP20 family protein